MPLIPGKLRSGWCIRAVAVADDEECDGGCILEGGEAQGECDGDEKLDRVEARVNGSKQQASFPLLVCGLLFGSYYVVII